MKNIVFLQVKVQGYYLVNKLKKLGDVVGDAGDVRVLSLQMLLVDFAHALKLV